VRSVEHVVIIDSNNRICHLSQSLVTIGEGEAESLIGKPLNAMFEDSGCESLRRLLQVEDSDTTHPNLRLRDLQWLRSALALRWHVSRLHVDGKTAFVVLSSSVDIKKAGDFAGEIFSLRLGKLVDEAKLALFVTDREGRIVVFNKGAEAITGYARSDVLEKRTVADLFPLASELELISSVLDDKKQLEGCLMSLRTSDGSNRPISLISKPLLDHAGESAGMVSVALDSSGEQSMAAELEILYLQMERFSEMTARIISIEETNTLFQHFANAITDISDFSRTLISIFIDEPPYRKIIAHSGVDEQDIEHLHQVEFPPEKLLSVLRDEFRLGPNCYYIPGSKRSVVLGDEEVATGTAGSEAINGWHPDDNLLVTLKSGDDLLGFFSLDDSKSGRRPTPETVKPLDQFALQITEVLARNRLEEELRSRHRDLQLLYEIMVIVNSSLDAGEVLQKLVESIKERMGYSLVSVYLIEDTRLILRAIHGASHEEASRFLELGTGIVGSAAAEGRVIISNDVKSDARYIKGPVDAHSEIAVPIKSSTILNGEETESIIGVLNIENIHPTTLSQEDGRRLEAIAATASVAIENSRLMDRVLSLLKEEANYSQELELRKSELDEFVYTISHDLKSPLSSIKGYAEMLELEMSGKIDENAARFIERIKANAEVVSRMINDLLELSRVGKVVEESRPVALEPLLREIALDLRASAEGEAVEIKHVDIPEKVTTDRRRLGQLFTNLVNNAYKYRHPDRKPVITIGCVPREDEFLFFVEDNGIGIDQRHLQSIFVFGVRVREAKVEGTGAGLAIAKKIVETMGGRIWVESEKGKGSTFYFTLTR